MRVKMLMGVAVLGLFFLLQDAHADNAILYEFDGSFEDATFLTKEAIIGQGLTIDYVSHVGEMLARTKNDVGGSKDIFQNAEAYLFCSASISRRVMEKDPMNVAHCPYSVFVIQIPGGQTTGDEGKIFIGHRDLPDGAMQEVEDLLRKIAEEATSF